MPPDRIRNAWQSGISIATGPGFSFRKQNQQQHYDSARQGRWNVFTRWLAGYGPVGALGDYSRSERRRLPGPGGGYRLPEPADSGDLPWQRQWHLSVFSNLPHSLRWHLRG